MHQEKTYIRLFWLQKKIESTNLLAFYVERINTKKGISKYLADVVNDKNLDEYADLIIDYLEQFRPKFVEELKKYNKKIEEYVKYKNENGGRDNNE